MPTAAAAAAALLRCRRIVGGFAAGALATNPDIKILTAQIGPAGYGDAAGGKSTTETGTAAGAEGGVDAIRYGKGGQPGGSSIDADIKYGQ